MSGNMNYRPEPTGRDSSHEFSYEERELICNAKTMRGMLDLLYRQRGLSRMRVDERDSHEGWHMEFDSWWQRLEALGERLRLEVYGPTDVLGTPPPVTNEDTARADEARRISRECGWGIPT